jgi:hypothetical protein
MLKTMVRIFLAIIIGLVCGILGWIIGALIGGNFAEQFVFNNVQGYEAVGQIGSILGTSIGLLASSWFLFKRKSLSSPR